MIDLDKARNSFKKYISNFDNQADPGFTLKVVHTYHVVDNAIMISEKLGLSEEDVDLAALIGILHDIGRFDELKTLKNFDSVENDHALFASKLLFDEGLISEFIDTDKYNSIIKKAIENHNKKSIENGLTEKELLHAKIIRDADKTDIFEAFMVEESGKGLYNYDEIGKLSISDEVYNYIMNCRQLDRKILKNDLEWFISNLSYTFDYNFTPGLKIIKEKKYIERIISKLTYISDENKMKISEIQGILLNYIDKRLKEE